MDPEQENLAQKLADQFKSLPTVVQNAITSADVQKHMRELADKHQLHIDQWQLLENEVMLALLGLQPIEGLEKNLASEVGVPKEIASALAADISKIVFEPIREELERSLDNPQAKDEKVSAVETAGQQAISRETAPIIAPATPPTPAPDTKAVRAPISEVYKPGEASTVRKSVNDDPYREPTQ